MQPLTRRGPGRPVDADPEVTRQRIRAAATRQLGHAGYAKTTMKSIAAEAGLTSGAIYHYFGSKPELVADLAGSVTALTVERLRAAATGATGFAGRVGALFDELLAVHRDHPDVARFSMVITSDVARYADLREAYESSSVAHLDLCGWVIDAAIADGDLPDDLDRRAWSDMLAAAIGGLTSQLASLPASHVDELVDAAKRLFAGTLFIRA